MAENQDGQEKTEEPSAKRLNDARQKGQVPRSREFNTFFMMVISAAALLMLGPQLMEDLTGLLEEHLFMQRAHIFDTQYMLLLLQSGFAEALWMMAPFFLVLIVVAIGSSVLVGGWNFAMQAMAFKGSKMNPLKGIKRIFGPQGLMELGKALAKVTLVGIAAVWILYSQAADLLTLGHKDMEPALAEVGEKMLWFFLIMSAALIVVAAIDAPFQLWNNKRQLRMTKEEVKKEHKQQEGSPEVKGRIRQIQMEMAQRRMMQKVPEADVVITNPTHYAVALKYDQDGGGAPVVVAKGSDEIAARIREAATLHNVPLLSSPALARAIYYSTELDEEIPSGLYMAVAKVLAYIFSLREKTGTDFSKPLHFEDVSIPEEYRRDS